MKNELDKQMIENEKNSEQIEELEKEKFSNTFCLENSSQASSTTDSPCKENEKDDFDSVKITDFFLQDLNFQLEFFPI